MLRTLGFDLGFAVPLALLTRGVLGDALAEELLADEGRHGLGVVLNAGDRAVGGAGAFPLEISLDESVSIPANTKWLNRGNVLHTSLQSLLLVSSLQRVSQVFIWAPHQSAVNR